MSEKRNVRFSTGRVINLGHVTMCSYYAACMDATFKSLFCILKRLKLNAISIVNILE